jgi:hypothetical protein
VLCTAEEDDTSAEELAQLLINNVWKLHELSSTIVSNRDSQFVSLVWKTRCKALKINIKFLTAFHSETNDQNEIVNQEMKRYLRVYCIYQQNDWSKWLWMTEFVFNAVTSTFIELFVFMTNYEFESRMSFESSNSNDSRERLSARERVLTQKTENIAEKMRDIWDFIKKTLINAQETQKKYANKKKKDSSEYKIKDMIWLFTKNIKIERSFKKLDHKWIESYKVKKILKDVCQLNLSSSMIIHDTFYISLLRSTSNDSFTEQIQSSSSSIVVEDEEKKYEVNDILNSWYHYSKLQYRMIWTSHFANKVWYSTENFEHSKEILNDYHWRYSDKSRSESRLLASITSMIDHFYWLQQAKDLVRDTLNTMQAKMKRDNQKEFSKDFFATKVLARKESWVSAY